MERKVFTIALKTTEPLRIGAQKDVMSAVDNPIAGIGGRPVVQGPTLKGALRGAIEQYLIERYPGIAGLKPCIPSSERTLSADEKKLIDAGLYRGGGACEYRSDGKGNKKPVCPACYFLGAMGLVGYVRVPTLYTDSQPETLYSIRGERASGTAADRTNRNYQIVPDRADFIGDLEIVLQDPARNWTFGKPRNGLQWDVDAWLNEKASDGQTFAEKGADAIIQEFILDRLESIDILGGFKSKGCGKVKITCTPVER